MQLNFYELGIRNEEELTFAVVSAVYEDKWVYVKHKERMTWEIPGGRRELGEEIMNTAKRELFEETGAVRSEIIPICDYAMNHSSGKQFGRLYFANIFELGQLPESEIKEVQLFEGLPENLTYAEIEPQLYKRTMEFLKANKQLLLK